MPFNIELETENAINAEIITIEEGLLDLAFAHCAAEYSPTLLKFQHVKAFPIFYYKFEIKVDEDVPKTNYGKKVVKVGLAQAENDRLQIQTPIEVRRYVALRSASSTKRRKLSNSRSSGMHKAMLSISTLSMDKRAAEDGVLCTMLDKHTIPLAETKGPLLVSEGNGRLYLFYSLAIISDQTVTDRNHQNISLKCLSRVLGDPTLVDPQNHQADPIEMLNLITRGPSKNSSIPEISLDTLRTNLLPYQRESVRWCLRKEGKELTSDGVIELDPSIRDFVISPPLGWRQIAESHIWVNPYLLKSSAEEPKTNLEIDSSSCKGKGLLAEEMGLGKTLELIALALLNPRPPSIENNMVQQISNQKKLLCSKATLVIVPRTILYQWVSEIKLHAPSLKILVLNDPNPPIDTLVNADFILVTYAQLSRWLPLTIERKQRATRKNRTKFSVIDSDDDFRNTNPHSTLVSVQFWRVILDEVQMVSTGTSAAAQVARRLPRVHAWVASGTPVKHSLEDLRGITYFLDLHPFVERPCWQRLISSPVDFRHVMKVIAIRHTKSTVADQLSIPKQQRLLILLRFSSVERARYKRLYTQFYEDAKNSNCNLSLWLLRLRQACSHAVAVGGNLPNNTLFSGSGSDIVPLTLDQVLGQLVDDADLQVWTEKREKINCQLQLGQLYDISYQMPKALNEWYTVVDQVKQQLRIEEERIVQLSSQAKAQQQIVEELERKFGTHEDLGSEEDQSDDETKEDEIKMKLDETTSQDITELRIQKINNDAKLFDERRALSIAQNRLKTSKLRCKSLRELLHRGYFFLGTGYFRSSKRLRLSLSPDEFNSSATQEVVKANFEKENCFYKLAEEVRGEILHESAERVVELAKSSRPLQFTKVHKMIPIPRAEIADKLASFANSLFDRVQSILSQPLLEDNQKLNTSEKVEDSGNVQPENETDAYAKTLDFQEYAFELLEILQIVLRDRAACINGGTIQPKPSFSKANDENRKFLIELIDKRESIVSVLHYDRVPLTTIAKSSGVSDKTISMLKNEVRACQLQYAGLRDSYNCRVEYYKQLQDLSDQVTDIDVGSSTDYDRLIMLKIRDINMAEHNISKKQDNQTYLRNLEGFNHSISQQRNDTKNNSVDGNIDNEDESKCTICLETIKSGALTPCGHFFCEECLLNWISTRERCPLCNRPVEITRIHKFRPENEIQEALRANDNEKDIFSTELKASSIPDDTDLYNASEFYVTISNKLYNKIHRMPINRMYGIKIDMIVRHAKYLRSQDPSAQIVVFSQWGTMLKVLKTAFIENRVSVATTTVTTTTGRGNSSTDFDVDAFRTNPEVACLLLHAKADVAGLTLVNANHVFLCEPLMNTALELQAVSRIRRIGQTRETTVWQFCVEDTVEQTILGITSKDRLRQSRMNEDSDENIVMEEASTQGSLIDRKSGTEIITDGDYLRRVLLKPDQALA